MPKKKKTKKDKKTNEKKDLTLESLDIPTYEDIKKEIEKKVGKTPSMPKGLPKGDWTKQSLRVLSERYLIKDEDGEVIETPEEMCWRVAWEIASAEARWGKSKKQVKKQAKKFYKMLVSRKFLPNSPTLMNAGTGSGLQYSACFVLPVEDSLGGIFDAIKYQALIHQTGGGTGFSFNKLRPAGSLVRTSKGVASGPVSFMRIFDSATNEIKQGGKRRGANMGILRVDHPDVMEFIHCKEEGGITNFNISVAITDEFMEAYREDGDYNLVDPRSGDVAGKLNAREVFDEIAQGAWRTGDPGLVFLDKMNKDTANPIPQMGPVEATNPCGEQPLYPFDACNLGSIFLSYFVKERGDKKVVDWKGIKKTTRMATRFLDNVIEVNPFPLEEIRRTVFGIRRIGLGVGGWADMLIELGIPYDSEEALKLGEKVMKTIQDEAVKTSQKLAEEREPFPMWPVSIYKDEKPRRNSTVTTIAPTGSISIIAGASSGIEPLYALAFQHIVKDKHLDRTLTFINPKFKEAAKEEGIWDEELKEKVADEGIVRGLKEVPKDLRDVFGTAHEIHHDWHIKMQAAFQKYTENAVSKTINMRNKVSKDDIKEAYLLAWETDCKGITVFRDGSKSAQVLNLGTKKKEKAEKDKETADEPTNIRPFVVGGSTYRLNTPVGTAFITINQDEEGEPLELFVNVGKAGSDVTAMAEALGRVISTSLRFRGNLKASERAKEIAHQLSGIGGRRSVGFGAKKVLSLPDAVASALSTHFKFKINGNVQAPVNGELTALLDKEGKTNGILEKAGARQDPAGAVMMAQNPASSGKSLSGTKDDHTMAAAESYSAPVKDKSHSQMAGGSTSQVVGDICPSCGASALAFQEGCAKCHVCGYSEC